MSKINFSVKNRGPSEASHVVVTLNGVEEVQLSEITVDKGVVSGGRWYIGTLDVGESVDFDATATILDDVPSVSIKVHVHATAVDYNTTNNVIEVIVTRDTMPEEPTDPEPAGCPFTSDYSTGSMNFGIRTGKTVADLGGMVVDFIFAEGTFYTTQLGIEEVGSLSTDRPEKLGTDGVIMLMEDSGMYMLQCLISMSEDMSGYESVLTVGELEIPFQFSYNALQAVAVITPEQRDALIGVDELCISVAEPVAISVPEADLSVHVEPVAGEEDQYLVTVANAGTPLDDVRVSMHLSGTYTGNGYTQHYFDIDRDIEVSHGELDSSTIPNWLVGRMEDGDIHTMKIGIKPLSVLEDITMEFRASPGYTYPEIPDPNPDNNSFFYTFAKGEMPDPVTFHLNDGVTDDTLLEFDIMGRIYNIPVVTAYNSDGSREVEVQQVYYSSNNIFRAPLAAGDTRVDVTMLTEHGAAHTGVFKFPSYTPRAVDARKHIIGVDWGVNTRYSGYVFDRLEELVSVPDFLPSTVTTAAEMFIDCFKINDPNIAAWDVSNVTDMTRMFRASLQGTSLVFNQDLSGWCVSNIPTEPTDFAATRGSWDVSKHPVWGTCPQGNSGEDDPTPVEGFVIKTTDGAVLAIEGTGQFPGTDVSVSADGYISGNQLEEVVSFPEEKPDWLEGNGLSFYGAEYLTKVPDTLPAWITDMSYMFYGCSSFNQDISGWDTSNVTNMSDMFSYCSSFNQDISGWDVSSVTDMANMFLVCSSFNQDLSGWNTSNVTNMSSMFSYCTIFDGDLSGWDTSNVTGMSDMFYGCSSFNGGLSGWDTSNVTDMSRMFYGCSSFNQDISGWDVSNVTSMAAMLRECSSFNQDLSGWCVSKISSNPFGFSSNTPSWTLPKPVWGTCPQMFIRLDYRDAVEGSVGTFSAFGKYNGDLISGQAPASLGEPVYRNGFYYHPVVYTDGSQSFTVMRISQEPEIDFNGSSGQSVLDNIDSAGLDRIEVTYAGVVSNYVVPRSSYTPSGNFLEIQAGPWPSQVVYNNCKNDPVGNFIKLFWN